jgi:hypothetical protein
MGDARDFLVLDEAHAVIDHDHELGRMSVSDYRLVTPLATQSDNASLTYVGDLAGGDAWIKDVRFDLASRTAAVPDAFVIPGPFEGETVFVDIPAVDVTTHSATTFADEWTEPELARMSGAFTLDVGARGVTLLPSVVEELARFAPGARNLLSEGEIKVESVSVDAELREGGELELRGLSLDAALMGATLPGSGPFAFSLSFDGSGELLEVRSADPGVWDALLIATPSDKLLG